MIKNVSSSSPHIYAAGGSSLPYIQFNQNNPSQGILRINGSDMEVYNGSCWTKIYMTDANIGLSEPANSAIDWAIKKMREEKDREKLAETNQAVKIALNNLDEARRQLEITVKIAKEHE